MTSKHTIPENSGSHPEPVDYSGLTPDTLLDAVDACGYRTDGRVLGGV